MDTDIIWKFSSLEEIRQIIREVIKEEVSVDDNSKSVPKFLTSKEAAHLLRISLPTLLEYRKRGIVQSIKIGSRVLFSEEDLLLIIDSKRTGGQHE
jgi:excisionase family DNA binding protein